MTSRTGRGAGESPRPGGPVAGLAVVLMLAATAGCGAPATATVARPQVAAPTSSPVPTASRAPSSTSVPSPVSSSPPVSSNPPETSSSQGRPNAAVPIRALIVQTATAPLVTPPRSLPSPAVDVADFRERELPPSVSVAATGTPGPADNAGTTAAEAGTLQLVNAERARVGCPALRDDPGLARLARAHSADMAARDYVAHDTPDGVSPFARMAAAGYRYRTAAENIAAGQPSAADVVRDWMASPSHREIILDCSLRRAGTGLALSGSARYQFYWTQDFATG